MKFLLIIFALFCAGTTYAQADESYFDEVIFIDFHDPGFLKLKNREGLQYNANFYYEFIKYEDVRSWDKGENILIQWTEKKGLGIIRRKTGMFYKVHFSEKNHPIDIELTRCSDRINDCYIDTGNRWKEEYELAFDYFVKKLNDPDLESGFQETQKSWDHYENSVLKSYRSVPIYEGGTMKATLAAKLYNDLNRSRYLHVLHFYD